MSFYENLIRQDFGNRSFIKLFFRKQSSYSAIFLGRLSQATSYQWQNFLAYRHETLHAVITERMNSFLFSRSLTLSKKCRKYRDEESNHERSTYCATTFQRGPSLVPVSCGIILGADDKTTTFLCALVDGLDDVDQFLFVF